MQKINELILHCLDNRSDKVYIFEIFVKSDYYFLSASWGKRDSKALATQLKGRFLTLTQAVQEMNRLANKKKKKGYERAKLDLVIPGHVSLDDTRETSSNIVVDAKGDTELGMDEHGNILRDIL